VIHPVDQRATGSRFTSINQARRGGDVRSPCRLPGCKRVATIDALRDAGGCSWVIHRTRASLLSALVKKGFLNVSRKSLRGRPHGETGAVGFSFRFSTISSVSGISASPIIRFVDFQRSESSSTRESMLVVLVIVPSGR